MTNGSAEKIKLSGRTVTVHRNVTFMSGAKELATGDRMLVEYTTGDEEDVVIIKEDGELRVKRLVQQLQILPSSPSVSPVTTVGFSLVDLDGEAEKRFLAIYEMFPHQAA